MGLLFILVSLVWRCEHDSGVFPLTSGWKDVTHSSSWSAVHCGNESRWQTVCVAARACTRWWSPATRTLIRPSKPIVFCLFRLQREYRSAWGRRKKRKNTTTQSNAAVCQRALGGGDSSLRIQKLYHESCRNMCTWTNKLRVQSAQAEEALKCVLLFFCLR